MEIIAKWIQPWKILKDQQGHHDQKVIRVILVEKETKVIEV